MNFDMNYMENEGKILQESRETWIEQRVKMGGDRKVIVFIADILFHGGNGVSAKDSVETIRSLFEAGYCYYFAKILEQAFPGGQVCMCCFFGHVVYVFEGVAYDVHGVSDAEHEAYVPMSEFGDGVLDFMHVPGKASCISYNRLHEIGRKCIEEGRDVIAISAYDQSIVDKSRRIANPQTEEDKQIVARYEEVHSRLINEGVAKERREQKLREECCKLGFSWDLARRFRREQSDSLHQIQF